MLLGAAANAAGSAALAMVDGDVAVTEDDFLYYYLRTHTAEQQKGITLAEVSDFVERLVSAQILVLEAEAAGYGEDPYVIKTCADIKAGMLEDALWKALAPDSDLREEELNAFFDINTKWRKYSLIVAKNREEAEKARVELDAGTPWEDVLRRYTILERDKERGVYASPLVYDGFAASRAVFATSVGEYTPAVPANDDIRWCVYRVDKVVHGRTDNSEEARPGVKTSVKAIKAANRFKEIVRELRKTVNIKRNEEMQTDLHTMPFLSFYKKWANEATTASDVGGFQVTGAAFALAIDDIFKTYGQNVDEVRENDPADFTYVTDRVLTILEDRVLQEVEASRRGLDKKADFVREYAQARDLLLTELFISQEFTAKLTPLTDEDFERYFAEHNGEFIDSEVVEVYLVAMPTRDKVERFYEDVAAGADLVETGEKYNAARGKKLMDLPEAPKKLPVEKQDWLGVVRILRQPDAAEPDGPFAAELRPRAFPFAGLKELSEVFQLNDGRWAFFAPIYYRPRKQRTLTERTVQLECEKSARNAYLASDEVEELSQKWLAALRAKHTIELARERFAEVVGLINTEK